MFKKFTDDPDLTCNAQSQSATRQVGYLRVWCRRVVITLAAGMLLASSVGAVTERCNPRVSRWLPSWLTEHACDCNGLLLESGGHRLLDDGGKFCLSR